MAADGGSPVDVAVVAVASLVGTVVAYLDLFGTGLAAPGDASLLSFAAVLAFLAPALIVLRTRYRRWLAHPVWARWPDGAIAAAAVALICTAVAHLIGEGAALGLVTAVLAAAAIAYAAARVRA